MTKRQEVSGRCAASRRRSAALRAEPAAQSQAKPAAANAWRCGHPRTPENTKRVRKGAGEACLQCFRDHDREYSLRKRRARGGRWLLRALPPGWFRLREVSVKFGLSSAYPLRRPMGDLRKRGLVVDRFSGSCLEWKITASGMALREDAPAAEGRSPASPVSEGETPK